MRKRSRGRGQRGGAGTRGTRGKVVKFSNELPHRQSSISPPSSTIRFVCRTNTSDKDSDEPSAAPYLNGTSSPIRNHIKRELKIKNGLAAVSSFSSIMENAAAVIDPTDFYLHKKFKKVSATIEVGPVNLKSTNSDSLENEQIPLLNGNSVTENKSEQISDDRFERKRKNGSVMPPIPSIRDITASSNNNQTTFPHSNEKDELLNLKNHNNISLASSVLQNSDEKQSFNDISENRVITSNGNKTFSNSNNNSAAICELNKDINSKDANLHEGTNNNTNSNGAVYKPKFHKLITNSSVNNPMPDNQKQVIQNGFPTAVAENLSQNLNETAQNFVNNRTTNLLTNMSNNSTHTLVANTSQFSAAAGLRSPGKINADRRNIDRQSLDDRISKIIDANQSILATLPDYVSKRQRSHHNSGNSSSNSSTSSYSPNSKLQRSSSIILSGGTATEFNFGQSGLAFDLSVRKSSKDSLIPNSSSMPKAKPKAIVRSQSDLSENLALRNLHLLSSTQSSSTMACQLGNTTKFVVDRRSDDVSLMESEQFVVPKKRRKLSPAAFCGGEVSEIPANEIAARYSSGSADLDMTVRVSNCSGAKVTVRANTSSSATNSNNNLINVNKLCHPTSSSGGYVSVLGDVGFTRNNPYQPHSIVMGCPPESSSSSSHKFPSNNSGINEVMDLKVGKLKGGKNGLISLGNSSSRKYSDSVVNYSIQRQSEPLPISSLARKPMAVLPSPPAPVDLKKLNAGNANLSSRINEISKMNDFVNVTKTNLALPSSSTSVFQASSPKALQSVQKEINSATASQIIKNEKNLDKPVSIENSVPNPKRPNFLALRPMNPSLKKSFDSSLVLPSPDTPRGAKPYNQMYINGHAYTYLGFKVSTRSSYTCLFRPQPMFIPQETDPKLSMYSNWQPRPKDPNSPITSIATNDSSINRRKTPTTLTYVSAIGKNCGTKIVDSSNKDKQKAPIFSTFDNNTLTKGSLSGKSEEQTPNSSRNNSPIFIKTESVSSAGLITASSHFTNTTSSSSSSSLSRSNAMAMSHENDEDASSSLVSQVKSRKRRVNVPPTKYLDNSTNNNINHILSSASSSSLPQQNILQSKLMTSSYSDISGSEESNGSNSRFSTSCQKSTKSDDRNDVPISLVMTNQSNSSNGSNAESSKSPNSMMLLSRLEQAKVRVIEGGFESNEDYTYVRGRGRGRYVCEACGIRCKKPSMLRKHLKTHTDLRPYTCKLCNFSFKTKGNLTKHQKSKSHHKKCFGLGIDPNSSRSLAMIGPQFDTDEEDSDDADDDDDDDLDSNEDEADHSSSQDNELENSFEKEIAQSLLDLSRVTNFSNKNADVKILADDKNTKKKSIVTVEGQPLTYSKEQQGENKRNSSSEIPIDLSVKNSKPEGRNKSERAPNGIMKSVGVVGEAQRWEPEEELANGCLNLTKVLNKNIVKEEVSDSILNSKTPPIPIIVAAPAQISTPTPPPVELKVEVNNYSTSRTPPDKIVATVRPYEFEITKKRQRLSNSCSEISPACNGPLALPSTSSSKASESLKETEMTSAVPPKPAKLHQPWLSPVEKAIDEDDDDDSNDVDVMRERTESFNSSVSTCESSVGCKDEVDNSNLEPSTSTALDARSENSSLTDGLVKGTQPKMFSGLLSLKPQAEFRQPSGAQAGGEGKAECNVCGKTFSRASQLTLHMNIHYLERPFRCDPCGVSFRTKGHLIKHRRSSSHDCKVYLTEAWGVANEENPRPFKCADCKIAFRIHGHLAKHLRSKMHIMRMECIGKLPFGIYFEMEKSGMNLNEIDTTDCDMSLVSLQNLAKKIYGDSWEERLTVVGEESS